MRISALILLIFFIQGQFNIFASERPKVGLVLSGGGAKGFAHIGVLEVLEKNNVPIDLIVGTSIGSIIGGLYSIGYNSEQLKEFVTNEEWSSLLSDYISREYKNINEKYDQDRYLISFKLNVGEGISLPAGVVEGHNVMNKLCELTAKYHEVDDFNKFPIPFACVAADIESGKEVVLRNGFLPEAMFASMSIPTVFAPLNINNKLLVDGGIVNNFPSDIARQMGADIIIGIDIQTKPLTKNEIRDLTDVIGQLISYMGFEKYKENRNLCNIIIEPDISGYDITSFSNSSADSLIIRGKNAALDQIDLIKEILDENKIPLDKAPQQYTYNNKFTLNNFMVEGIGESTIDYLLNKSDLAFPNSYSFSGIREGIKRLYGSNTFKKAYFRLLDSKDKTFRLIIDEKTTNSMNAGFNFNSVDKAAILLNLTFRNQLMKGTRFSIDAKLSSNTMLGAHLQLSRESFPELELSSVYKNFNIEIYDRNDKISEADLRYLKTSFSISEIFGSNYLFNIGVSSEYYKFAPYSSENSTKEFSTSENTVLGVFGTIRFDNLDDKYFPKSGFDLFTEFTYASNKADDLFENTTTPMLMYNFKSALSITDKICFLPNFYGRLLLNNNSEIYRANVIGGSQVTKLLDYHLPFIGVNRVVFIKDKAFITRMELRGQISKNNYISLIINGATYFTEFKDWQTRELIGGYGLKYSYNSFIGPIDFLLSTSDYTDKINFFVNVGKWL